MRRSGTLDEDASVGGISRALANVVVDVTGAVTGGTITTGSGTYNVIGRGMFCVGNHMAGYLVTQAAEASYKKIFIYGTFTAGTPNTISGNFESDETEFGTLALTGQ